MGRLRVSRFLGGPPVSRRSTFDTEVSKKKGVSLIRKNDQRLLFICCCEIAILNHRPFVVCSPRPLQKAEPGSDPNGIAACSSDGHEPTLLVIKAITRVCRARTHPKSRIHMIAVARYAYVYWSSGCGSTILWCSLALCDFEQLDPGSFLWSVQYRAAHVISKRFIALD